MRKSTIAIGIAAALSTQAFVTPTSADAAVKHKLQKASGPTNVTRPQFKYPAHTSPTGGSVLYDQTGTVGTATTVTGFLTTGGTYYWKASYNGDQYNAPFTTSCGKAGDEKAVVTLTGQ